MRQIKFLTLALLTLSISACETWDGLKEDFSSLEMPDFGAPFEEEANETTQTLIASGHCPTAQIVDELGSTSEFSDVSDPQEYNLVSRVNLSQVESNCSYSGKSATVDLKLAFEGTLGPRGQNRDNQEQFSSHPFFVAVVAPGGDIMAKEIFSASMTYDPGQTTQTYFENLRQVIPIANQTEGNKYKVLVGFQLNQDQLAYNRGVIKSQRIAAEAAAAAQASRVESASGANTSYGTTPVEAAPVETTPEPYSGPIDLTAPNP